MYLCEHIVGSFLLRVLEGAHRNDGLNIKLNQFHGKSTSDIAHEATHISKICAVNCRLSSNLLQDFSFQERKNTATEVVALYMFISYK